jgi:hypothetical protein
MTSILTRQDYQGVFSQELGASNTGIKAIMFFSTGLTFLIFVAFILVWRSYNNKQNDIFFGIKETDRELIDIISKKNYREANLSDIVVYSSSSRAPSFMEFYANYNPQNLLDFCITLIWQKLLRQKKNSIKMFLDLITESRDDLSSADIHTKLPFDDFIHLYQKYCIKKKISIKSLLSTEAKETLKSFGIEIIEEFKNFNISLLNIKLSNSNSKRVMTEFGDKLEISNINSLDFFIKSNCRLTGNPNHKVSLEIFNKSYKNFCKQFSINPSYKGHEHLFEFYGIPFIAETKKYIHYIKGSRHNFIVNLRNAEYFINERFDEEIQNSKNFFKLIYHNNFGQRYFNIIFWNYIHIAIIMSFLKYKFLLIIASIFDLTHVFRMLYYREHFFPFVQIYNFQINPPVEFPLQFLDITLVVLTGVVVSFVRVFLLLASFFVNENHLIVKLLIYSTRLHDTIFSLITNVSIFLIVWEITLLISASLYVTLHAIHQSLLLIIFLGTVLYLAVGYLYTNYLKTKYKKFVSALVSDYFKRLVKNYLAHKHEQKANYLKVMGKFDTQNRETIRNRISIYRKNTQELIHSNIHDKEYANILISYLYKEPFENPQEILPRMIGVNEEESPYTISFIKKLILMRISNDQRVIPQLDLLRFEVSRIIWLSSKYKHTSSFETADMCLSLIRIYDEFYLASKKNNFNEMTKNLQFISEILHFLSNTGGNMKPNEQFNYFSDQHDHNFADSVFDTHPFRSISSQNGKSYTTNTKEYSPMHLLVPFIVDICFARSTLDSIDISKTLISAIVSFFESPENTMMEQYIVFEHMFDFKQISNIVNKSQLNNNFGNIINTLISTEKIFDIIITRTANQPEISKKYEYGKCFKLQSIDNSLASYQSLMFEDLFKNHFLKVFDHKYIEFFNGLLLLFKTPSIQNNQNAFIRTEHFGRFKHYIGYGFHTIKGLINLLQANYNSYTEHLIFVILRKFQMGQISRISNWINFVFQLDKKQAFMYFMRHKMPSKELFQRIATCQKVEILTLYSLFDNRNRNDEAVIKKIVAYLRMHNLRFWQWSRYFSSPKCDEKLGKHPNISRFFQQLIVYHEICKNKVGINLKQIFRFFGARKTLNFMTFDELRNLKKIVRALDKVICIGRIKTMNVAQKIQKSQNILYFLGLKMKKLKEVIKIIISQEPISLARFERYFNFLNITNDATKNQLQYCEISKIIYSKHLMRPMPSDLVLDVLVNDFLKLMFKQVY